MDHAHTTLPLLAKSKQPLPLYAPLRKNRSMSARCSKHTMQTCSLTQICQTVAITTRQCINAGLDGRPAPATFLAYQLRKNQHLLGCRAFPQVGKMSAQR